MSSVLQEMKFLLKFYDVNDKMLLLNVKKGGKGLKMENNWLGLYIIQLVNEKGVVFLKKYNGKVLFKWYNWLKVGYQMRVFG